MSFNFFRQVISKFSEIMADNSQRFLVIGNQVNLNGFSNNGGEDGQFKMFSNHGGHFTMIFT